MVNSDTASDLLKILKLGILPSLLSLTRKLNLQRQGTALEVVLLDAPDQFHNRVIQMDGDSGILVNVRFKGLLTTDTLPLPLADNRPIVDASRDDGSRT